MHLSRYFKSSPLINKASSSFRCELNFNQFNSLDCSAVSQRNSSISTKKNLLPNKCLIDNLFVGIHINIPTQKYVFKHLFYTLVDLSFFSLRFFFLTCVLRSCYGQLECANGNLCTVNCKYITPLKF